MEFATYRQLLSQVSVGKRLPQAQYLHRSALPAVSSALAVFVDALLIRYDLADAEFNVLKLFRRDFRISLLWYPGFFEEPYPTLLVSTNIDLVRESVRTVNYHGAGNPQILHRKELLLSPDHPEVPRFAALTAQAEALGLHMQTSRIGFLNYWQALIRRKGYTLEGERFVPLAAGAADAEPSAPSAQEGRKVQRHRTALSRYVLSAPMQSLARHGYLDGRYSLFDYGCGKGDDVRELQAHGVQAQGWDPAFAATATKSVADIVNLGYVINVIEDQAARRVALEEAYQLARKVLVVAAMLGGESVVQKHQRYGDGVLTLRGTFQKYYLQQELRHYIERTLAAPAVAVGPGLFYVFKDPLEEQTFLAERQRNRVEWQMRSPRQPPQVLEHGARQSDPVRQALLEDYWRRCLELGRLPAVEEYERVEELRHRFGSVKRASEAALAEFDAALLAEARQARTTDLLVYFAMNLFGRRKPYSQMPQSLQRDVTLLFDNITSALQQAKELLFSVGNLAVIEEAAVQAAGQGKGYLDDAHHSLHVHSSLVNQLPSVLRVYVGCAAQLYGDVETADVVKVHIRSGKLSLLIYDDFEKKPIPRLVERIKIKLRTQDIDFFDYVEPYEPPPLYWKSRWLPPEHPIYNKQWRFEERLSKLGIVRNDFEPGWSELEAELAQRGLKLQGFQLRKARGRQVRRSPGTF